MIVGDLHGQYADLMVSSHPNSNPNLMPTSCSSWVGVEVGVAVRVWVWVGAEVGYHSVQHWACCAWRQLGSCAVRGKEVHAAWMGQLQCAMLTATKIAPCAWIGMS